jgi:hypothetical protein
MIEMRNLETVAMADVAMLLMCCQRGEVDQKLSLNVLQLKAALSHTSACLNGLATRTSESCSMFRSRMERTGHENSSIIGSVGYALPKKSHEHMTPLHERPRPLSAL